MTTVISVHSFRGGTGKSNTTSNLAAQLAAAGNRVAVVDTDIQSPGIHVLFGFSDDLDNTLNDYLWGKLPIKDTAHDVTIDMEGQVTGRDEAIVKTPQWAIAAHPAACIENAADVCRRADGILDDVVAGKNAHPGGLVMHRHGLWRFQDGTKFVCTGKTFGHGRAAPVIRM